MKKHLSPLILLLASVIWGAAFVAQKAASSVPPLALGSIRSVFAVLFLFPAVMLFDKLTHSGRSLISFRGGFKLDITKSELIGGTVSGSFLFIASSLQQIGIGSTDAGKASFITALYVVIVPVYAFFLGKRPRINVWISVGIAIVGFYLLCLGDGFSLAPSDLIILLCAFVFAMQIISIDHFLPRSDAVRLSLVQFSTCSVLSLVSSLIFEKPLSDDILLTVGTYLPELLFLGVCSSGIAYTCQIIGQKNTPATVATLILSLESVFGALFGALLLGERLSIREYIGCAVVFIAVILAEIELPAKKKPDVEEKTE